MMDSQELNQVANIDATVVNDEQTEVSAEVAPRKVYTSKQELLDRVKELAHGFLNIKGWSLYCLRLSRRHCWH